MRVVVVAVKAADLLNFRREMLRAFVAQGHDVLAVAPDDDLRVRVDLQAIGVAYSTVPLRRSGTNPLRDAVTLVALTRIFRRHRADLVFVSAAKPVVYGLLAARLARTKLRAAMITGVGSALGGTSGWWRRALHRLLRFAYAVALRQAHVVFFQNPDDARLFVSLGLVGSESRIVQVNGSGVGLERFSPAAYPPVPITFIFIGRLIRDKGVGEYVKASRLVRRRHPEVRFQLLGALDTNPSGISPAELDALRDEGIIEYLGVTTDVRPFIRDAHVCVLPSYGEGTPHTVLEAMAMGRAILTTDVPGCRETVEAGRNGYLVSARDPVALADGMNRMIDDQGRLELMGRESRVIAEKRFDVHAVNRVILDELGLASQHGPSGSRGVDDVR
jgi:Glycosyltransferase